MKKQVKIVKVIGFALIGTALVLVLGFVVMYLWNAILPDVLGVKTITFWQAMGIFVLAKILFGGFKGGHHKKQEWRRKMHDKWEQMSPEERQQWKQNMRNWCGQWGKPMPPTNTEAPINPSSQQE